jgi:hypothetical protein
VTKKPLYMETTEIAAERTAGEIVTALVNAGANQINMEYKDGKIIGLRWIMRVGGTDALFAMPARVEPIYKILRKRVSGYVPAGGEVERKLRAKATRVAWRQLLRWVQAQAAMIECGMTEAGEVFFPYLQTPSGQTIFETFKESGIKALPAPEKAQ